MSPQEQHMYRSCALPLKGPPALPVPSRDCEALCSAQVCQSAAMWLRSVKAIGLTVCSKRPTYGYSFQDILQLSVNQCQSVNTATFTWHPPVFAARVETDRWAGESGKPCPHARTECFNLLKDTCAIVITIYMAITTQLPNRQVWVQTLLDLL